MHKGLCMVTCVGLLSLTCNAEKGHVILGPGFQPNQQSNREILYRIPPGWQIDVHATQAHGLVAVLVPKGLPLGQADRAITIAFQKKNLALPGLDSLESFFRVAMDNAFRAFPDLQASRWQPRNLDPDEQPFMSLELYGVDQDNLSPHRVLFLDSGDGFFSITATVSIRDQLNEPLYTEFFDNIKITKKASNQTIEPTGDTRAGDYE